MATKSQKYYQKRAENLELMSERTALEYRYELEKAYLRAEKNIDKEIQNWYYRIATNNDITLAEARKLLKRDELREFKWTLKEYIKYGEDNALDGMWLKELENASAKVHISRLESIKLQLRQYIEDVYAKEIHGTSELIQNIYKERFYHTAYELQKGVGIGWDLQKVDTGKLDKLLQRRWSSDGMTLSEKIWTHRDATLSKLQTGLTQALMRGDSVDNLIKSISKTMQTSKSNAGRLVMTESAYYSSEASKDCFKELGVEKYEILATLDTRTSDMCQDMDGRVFDMKDYQSGLTAPPFHPYCRSTTVPYFDDMDDFERVARDEHGNAHKVPSNMKYKQWYEKYIK